MPEINTPVSQKFYYRKMGAGPVLVLLHGFPATGSLWGGIAGKLAETNTLIIPDLPGTGSSTLDDDGISIAQIAEAIKAILDSEGITKAIIAGHSMGGYVALAFAGMYPAVVAGLALVQSTALADDEERKQVRLKAIALLQKSNGKELFVRQAAAGLFSQGFLESNDAAVQAFINTALSIPAEIMVSYYRAMMERPDLRAVLTRAVYPVQWLLGKNDNLIPYKKTLEQTHLSPVNFVSLYDNCGHMSMLEIPAEVMATLSAFARYCNNYPYPLT